MSALATPAVTTPVTLSRLELAAYLGRSEAAFDRDLALGRIPAGFRLGRCRKWLKSEIDAWLAAGAPDQKTWEAMKKSRRA
jgi:predicted DNA-binding transcriptional regulator AlpA